MKHLPFAFALLCAAACGDDDAGPEDATVPADAPAPPVVGLAFEPVDAPGDFYTDMAVVPGRGDELLIATHLGDLLHLRVSGDAAELLGTIEVPEVWQHGDCGLLSVAFDPEWETNQLLFTGHCIEEDAATRITRLTFDGSTYDVADSAVTILEVHETRGPYPWNHAISNLLFEGDVLVAGIGDKSAVETAPADPTSLAGSILRVIPSRGDEGGYEPAPDNPFDGAEGAPEVWAYGMRHPWRMIHGPGGSLLFGDVGEGGYEELNFVDGPGLDFGWHHCSGPCDPPEAGRVDPILHYTHTDEHPYVADDPETTIGPNRAIWVAPGRPAVGDDPFDGLLDGRVLFGDVCTGWVRAVRVGADGSVSDDDFLAHQLYITSIVWTPDGTGYATSFGSCSSIEPLEPAQLLRIAPRRGE